MIGQEQLLNDISLLVDRDTFPRFCILTGPRGSGKKLIAHHIGDILKCTVVNAGTTVTDIRTVIDNCYNLTSATLYIMADADNMSVQAKNALLKVTEEPPNRSYFIITLEDINNTLETIRSRAVTFQLEPYTPEQLVEYAISKQYDTDINIIEEICDTPGEVDTLCQYDVPEFYNFVNTTIDHIATVSGANVFKLTDRLKLKEDGDGYDVKLFFKMFMKVCWERYSDTDDIKYTNGVLVTSDYLKDLRITGISKPGVVDLWILDMRREWM